MKKSLTILLTIGLLASTCLGYGPRGHALVGAIADRRLAQKTTTKNKVKVLLDGLTLQRAATLPDEIKSLDSNPNGFHLPGHRRIENELRAFVAANPRDGSISHHQFHYTDVPVAGNEKYASGKIGRSDFDIVQMIPFCIRVLNGQEPASNPRKITRSVAVILLAHYLGDIHQPLHVGAEYFNAAGNPFEPTAANKGFEDQGGNKLTLFTLINGSPKSAGKFHGYWDSQTVNNAVANGQDFNVVKQLASKEPADWRLAGDIETWAEQMADEIMPLAREAHTRLKFSEIKIVAGEREIISGKATEKKKTSGTFYAIWAAATVKDEIHKAGWRLAAILEEALQ
jgi:hypothetical protein